MSKEALRAATLGRRKEFKKEIVTVGDTDFEIRQPTIAQRGEIQAKAMKINSQATSKDDRISFDMFAFMIAAVVELTYVPGTDERVFSEEDYEEMKSLPAGSWFDKFSSQAAELCNVKDTDVKKPSEGTEESN